MALPTGEHGRRPKKELPASDLPARDPRDPVRDPERLPGGPLHLPSPTRAPAVDDPVPPERKDENPSGAVRGPHDGRKGDD